MAAELSEGVELQTSFAWSRMYAFNCHVRTIAVYCGQFATEEGKSTNRWLIRNILYIWLTSRSHIYGSKSVDSLLDCLMDSAAYVTCVTFTCSTATRRWYEAAEPPLTRQGPQAQCRHPASPRLCLCQCHLLYIVAFPKHFMSLCYLPPSPPPVAGLPGGVTGRPINPRHTVDFLSLTIVPCCPPLSTGMWARSCGTMMDKAV
jgi:hypothetical protein